MFHYRALRIVTIHCSLVFCGIFSLDNVEECNTLFVHVILFRCAESLIYLPVLFEQVYIQMPEVNTIIFIKPPGTKICEHMIKPSCGVNMILQISIYLYQSDNTVVFYFRRTNSCNVFHFTC